MFNSYLTGYTNSFIFFMYYLYIIIFCCIIITNAS